MNNLIARFFLLPRAVRWAAVAALVFLAYFVVVERVIDRINTVSSKAEDRATALRTLANERAGSGAGDLALSVRKFGAVDLPGDPQTRPVAFDRRVVEILAKHKIKNDSSTKRIIAMDRGPLREAYGEEERVDRQIREIQFDATPEAIAAILADFENSPEVAAVSRVQLRRGDSQLSSERLLKATIAVETWVVSKKGGRSS